MRPGGVVHRVACAAHTSAPPRALFTAWPGRTRVNLGVTRRAPLAPAYDWYSFNVLPRIGRLVAKDESSYRYLAESIRVHPDQETLKSMMEHAGFDRVEYHNLAAGVVAVHVGRVF